MTNGKTHSLTIFSCALCILTIFSYFTIPSVSHGRTIWTQTHGDAGQDGGKGIVGHPLGGYVVTGYITPPGTNNRDLYLARVNELGETVWTQTYGEDGDERAYSIINTRDGNFIIVGAANTVDDETDEVYLVKAGPDGDEIWTRRIKAPGSVIGRSIQETSDGGFIITGNLSGHSDTARTDLYLVKTNAWGYVQWYRYFGGTNIDYGTAVKQTSDGGFIVTGVTYSFGAGNSDIYMVKTDSHGRTIWEKAIGGPREDEGHAVVQLQNGTYVVAGHTISYGAGKFDVFLVQVGRNGNVGWRRTHGGSDYDMAYSMERTRDGGYIIGGMTRSDTPDHYDGYLIKVDANFKKLWSETFGGEKYDSVAAVHPADDGSHVIAGLTSSFGAPRYDVYISKIRHDSAVAWSQTVGGDIRELGESILQTRDGGYIIAGSKSQPTSTSNSDVCLTKIDAFGFEEWFKTYGGSGMDEGRSVQLTADGGYIVAGHTNSFGSGGLDVYLLKTDASGNEIWSKTYGGPEAEYGYSIRQTPDGGYVIAGATDSYGAGKRDVYLIKTDADGNMLWQKTFGGNQYDFANWIECTPDNGYVMVGATESFGNGEYDSYVIKTDHQGNMLWDKTLGLDKNDIGGSLAVTKDNEYVIASTYNDGILLILDKLDENGDYIWGKGYGIGEYQLNPRIQETFDRGFIITGTTIPHDANDYDVFLFRTDSQGYELWRTTYGGSDYDLGYSVIQARDGGYVISGSTKSYGSGSYDIYVIKTAGRSVDALYEKTYGGNSWDSAQSIVNTSDGGYVLAGRTFSYGAGKWDAYLVKTDASGSRLWHKSFGGPSFDFADAVCESHDGGYILTGSTSSFGSGNYDVYVIKTDASGNRLWYRTFGGKRSDKGYSVRKTSDGGYIIAGGTYSYGAGSEDVYLVKIDAYGRRVWTRTHGTPLADNARSIQQTSDDGYIIAGFTPAEGGTGTNIYLLKTNPSGYLTWSKKISVNNADYAYSVQQTSDNGYIIAGYSNMPGNRKNDVVLVKTDSLGTVLWIESFGGNQNDYGYSVKETPDQGYIIAGTTESFGSGGFDAYMIKTDQDGFQVWSQTFGGPGNETAKSVVDSPDGSYAIGGSKEEGNGAMDMYLMKTTHYME